MKRLLLAGAGHAHALLLLQLARRPLPGVEVVVLSPTPLAPYSGMVPGWLAGQYRFDEIVVDVPPLAAAAGARWLPGALHALQPDARQAVLDDGSVLPYDVLSLNVGSTLDAPPAQRALVLPLRPLALLHERLQALLQPAPGLPSPGRAGAADARPLVLSAVGGGPAGFEGLLALLQRLRREWPGRPVRAALHTRDAQLLPALSAPARRAALRALQRAGVAVHTASGWSPALDAASDIVVWATGAQAHAWQRDPARRGSLAVDAQGFVCIDAQLRSLSHPEVFAVGDCASWPGQALPKAGVHAVRMAPVLGHNLRVALGGPGAFATYRPQRQMLALLSTADGRAIASRGGLGAEGAWAWRWKDHIDRRFMRQFRVQQPG